MRRIQAALSVAAAIALLALPGLAQARGWQGVTPGASTGADVATRFGPPSTQGKADGRTALVYKGEQAIPGTRQAQFYLRDDGVVGEVVVFPAAQLDREAVEGTYGHPVRKAFTDDFRNVWTFKGGVTVFFGKDGAVDAISFKPAEPAGRPEAAAREPQARQGDAAP